MCAGHFFKPSNTLARWPSSRHCNVNVRQGSASASSSARRRGTMLANVGRTDGTSDQQSLREAVRSVRDSK